MPVKLLFIFILLLFVYCNTETQQNTLSQDSLKRLTDSLKADSVQKLANAVKTCSPCTISAVAPGVIDFSFVIYDNYFIIVELPKDIIDSIYENPAVIKADVMETVMTADIKKEKYNNTLNEYINHEFNFYTDTDSLITLKTDSLKILVVGHTISGYSTGADISDDDKLQFIKERSSVFLVGVIHPDKQKIVYGTNSLKINFKTTDSTLRAKINTETDKKLLAKAINEKQTNFTHDLIFVTPSDRYYYVCTSASMEICGGAEYSYCHLQIVKISKTNQTTVIFSPGDEELLDVLDVNNDNIPEFIFRSKMYNWMYIEVPAGNLRIAVPRIQFPAIDPC